MRRQAPDAVIGEGLSVHYSGGLTLSDDIKKWLDQNGIHGDITYVDEALYEDKRSVVFDDLGAARETQDRIREFVRNHPTVYMGTHTPQDYENLEAKRVMDLDNPVPTVFAEVSFSERKASGKYVCSICGYVYDPAENDAGICCLAGEENKKEEKLSAIKEMAKQL